MFQKKYKISIANPCKENWRKMQDREHGRYCDVCSTVVTDFTMMSSTEIIKILKNKNFSKCGRFTTIQLKRHHSKNNLSDLIFFQKCSKYIASFFIFLFHSKNSGAQTIEKPETSKDSLHFFSDKNKINDDSTQILGKDSISIMPKDAEDDSICSTKIIVDSSNLNTERIVQKDNYEFEIDTDFLIETTIIAGYTQVEVKTPFEDIVNLIPFFKKRKSNTTETAFGQKNQEQNNLNKTIGRFFIDAILPPIFRFKRRKKSKTNK